MNPTQIALVQSSFDKVEPMAARVAKLFYCRLFETLPVAKPLFKGDMDEQGSKLTATLATIVGGLDRLDGLLPMVKGLATRHVGYGVRPEHYEFVGAALLWTLQQGLGADFTPAVAEAWSAAYGILSAAMIEAAYPLGSAIETGARDVSI